MEPQCQKALAQYLAYLEGQFVLLPERVGCRLVTPFSYQDGGSIELVLVDQPGGQVLITDRGATSDYLFLSGVHLEKNTEHLQDAAYVAGRHRVKFNEADSELSVLVTNGNLGEGLHHLLAAVIELGDMIFKQHPHSISTFQDEVDSFLVEHAVPVSRGFEVQGKASAHKIAFYINGRRNWLAQPVTATSRAGARRQSRLLAYQWLDIRNAGHEYTFVAILDDRGGQIERFWKEPEIGKPLYDYSDLVFEWDQRERLMAEYGLKAG